MLNDDCSVGGRGLDSGTRPKELSLEPRTARRTDDEERSRGKCLDHCGGVGCLQRLDIETRRSRRDRVKAEERLVSLGGVLVAGYRPCGNSESLRKELSESRSEWRMGTATDGSDDRLHRRW